MGGLDYLTNTRPDIAFYVSMLSQFMDKPNESHWLDAKRVLGCSKGTYNYGIEFTNNCNVELIWYSNPDWEGDVDDMRSTIGYVFNLGSGSISRSSKTNQMCPYHPPKKNIKHHAALLVKLLGYKEFLKMLERTI